MFEYRQVLVRMRLGASDRDIERGGLMGRRAAGRVRMVLNQYGWLDPSEPLPGGAEVAAAFARSPAGAVAPSLCEPFREQIVAWARKDIDASTIHEALERRHGFTGSYSSVQRFVKTLGLRAPQATSVLSFAPGEAAQVDFGTGPLLVDMFTGEVVKTWFFSMQLCYSRHKYIEFVTDQKVMTWLGCHRRAFEWFGGVPARVIIDNAKCAITKACRYDPVVQRAYYEHAEAWDFQIDALPPAQPQMKGRVERSVGFGWTLPFKYNGRDGVFRHEATNLYWMRARHYKPDQGRFMQVDPKPAQEGTADTAYSYGSNDPANKIDPDGQAAYNRAKAVRYAKRHAYDYSDRFKSYENDCTNFVSQVLWAGGWKMDNRGDAADRWWADVDLNDNLCWGCSTRTWKVVSDLHRYGRSIGRMHSRQQARHLAKGDIIRININGGGHHMMVVTKAGQESRARVTQHTTDRKDFPLAASMYAWRNTPGYSDADYIKVR